MNDKKKAFVLWFTGLSGSGKSTLAEQIYKSLKLTGLKVEQLDGDIVRSIFPKTGFSKEERIAHIKRIGFISSILERNGIIVLASFIAPYEESREAVRQMCNNYIEVFVNTSIDECERRDVKGLYRKVRVGEIKNFTGIDDPFEVPQNPEIIIDTEKQTINESKQVIKEYLVKQGVLDESFRSA